MSDVDLVKEITSGFCENTRDAEIIDQYFAADFVHWANGRQGGLGQYASRLERYGEAYGDFTISTWDEAFPTADGVVTAYILAANKRDGGADRFAVMAIWRLREGKVISLREVDAGV
jgi:hypothetical protein